MKRKIALIVFVIMSIGAWINFGLNWVQYETLANPTTWDTTKCVIDILVASAWTALVAIFARCNE